MLPQIQNIAFGALFQLTRYLVFVNPLLPID